MERGHPPQTLPYKCPHYIQILATSPFKWEYYTIYTIKLTWGASSSTSNHRALTKSIQVYRCNGVAPRAFTKHTSMAHQASSTCASWWQCVFDERLSSQLNELPRCKQNIRKKTTTKHRRRSVFLISDRQDAQCYTCQQKSYKYATSIAAILPRQPVPLYLASGSRELMHKHAVQNLHKKCWYCQW